MEKHMDFTQGKIVGPLFRFAGPILLALFLQAMYGAIDLAVVGRFGFAEDVSAVSTGSQILHTITNIICSFAIGTTVFLGQKIGEGKKKDGGFIIGASICLFTLLGIFLMILIPVGSGTLANIMQAPVEAFDLTVSYIRICGIGVIVIIFYNLIGSIFRGIGDSRTPLITVMIACGVNVIGDLLLVAVFHLGTIGAALATVAAQLVSVLISLGIIRKQQLPFTFQKSQIRWNGKIIKSIVSVGLPIALQDLLVGISFLVIMAIVNSLGVISSAGIGVAEKVCGFIMLVPGAFAQTMSAFVAQNKGAGKYDRATRSLWYAIGVSTIIDIAMFYVSFFHGDLLAEIFTKNPDVILAAADYLKAYGIDCLLTCFLFCFIGFFNGLGETKFVMIQGIVAAFAVRIPVAYIMSKQEPVSLFHIGLGIPIATALQIISCFAYYIYIKKKLNLRSTSNESH